MELLIKPARFITLKNITSDRKLVDHCSMRMDILYFLGYDIDEQLPWHSTISRTRQFNYEFLELRNITPWIPVFGKYKSERD